MVEVNLHMTKIGKILLEVFGAIFLGLLVLTAGLAWRLSEGPISLSFTEDILADYYQQKDREYQLKLEEPTLSWEGWNRLVEITFGKVSFSTADKNIVLEAPKATIRLSVLGLIEGNIRPKELTITSADIKIKDVENNRLVDNLFSSMPDISNTQEDTIQSNTIFLLSSLETIHLKTSTLKINHGENASPLILKNSTALITKEHESWAAQLDGIFSLDDGKSNFSANLKVDTETSELAATAQLSKVPIKSLSVYMPSFLKGASMGAPLDLKYDLKMNLMTRAKKIIGEIKASKGKFFLPTFTHNAIPFERMYANIKMDSFSSIPNFGELIIENDDFLISSKLLIDKETRKPRINWNISSQEIEVQKLKQYLSLTNPTFNKSDFIWSIQRGILRDLDIKIVSEINTNNFDDLILEDVSGSAAFYEVAYKTGYLVNELTELSGKISIQKDQIAVKASTGKYQNISLGNLSINLNLNEDNKPLSNIVLSGHGKLTPIIAFLKQEALGFETSINSIPENITGDAQFEINLKPYLKEGPGAGGKKYNAEAFLSGVTIPNFLLGEDLSKGNLELSISPEKTVIKGTGIYNGAPISFSQLNSSSASPSVTNAQKISFVIDGKRLSKLHGSTPFDATGPIPLNLEITDYAKGTSQVSGFLDLQNTKLTIPRLNWAKPAGSAGRLRFRALLENNILKNLDNLNLISADLILHAKASFSPVTSKLSSATVYDFQIGKSKMRGSVELRKDGIYHAKLVGPNLNINQLISDTLPSNESQERFLIEANFDEVSVWDLPPIKETELVIKNYGEFRANIELNGNVGNELIKINSSLNGEAREFNLSAGDAGKVLRGFEITNSIIGGFLQVDGEITGTGSKEVTNTKIYIRKFGVKDAPLFTQVLNAASPFGLLNTLRGKGIRFQELNAEVKFTPNKIEIKDSFASGTSLGVSTEGAIDRNTDQTSIKGMIVPAYVLNDILNRIPVVLNKIPVVGELLELLTGGEKEGLLAAEYLIGGTREEPQVTVNPLTAFTPGFLRAFVKATRKPLD